ncbi:hypothetical protein V5799_018505 [Amblyomma americanum]|uniref:Uncharacterized protein n=1 Tax=Amblyomma americanum TaxID=6943 RepID=A0AAQ4F0A8_AMBAM
MQDRKNCQSAAAGLCSKCGVFGVTSSVSELCLRGRSLPRTSAPAPRCSSDYSWWPGPDGLTTARAP